MIGAGAPLVLPPWPGRYGFQFPLNANTGSVVIARIVAASRHDFSLAPREALLPDGAHVCEMATILLSFFRPAYDNKYDFASCHPARLNGLGRDAPCKWAGCATSPKLPRACTARALCSLSWEGVSSTRVSLMQRDTGDFVNRWSSASAEYERSTAALYIGWTLNSLTWSVRKPSLQSCKASNLRRPTGLIVLLFCFAALLWLIGTKLSTLWKANSLCRRGSINY